ncbi:MAG: hypothetical protein NC307_13360 [Roseburia sp.]|nr:hypothetical protein [Roseburia sp.]
MKKAWTRLLAALLVCFMAVTVVPESVVQVQAAAKPKVNKKIDVIYYPSDNLSYHYIMIQNRTAKGKISNLKVKGDGAAEISLSMDKQYVMYRPKKLGKTEVSF